MLMLTDMKSVYPVDQDLIDRAYNWLLTRKDGRGGFKRDDDGLYGFGFAPYDVTNAFVCWSLTESTKKYKRLRYEIDTVIKKASKSFNVYYIALAALTALNCDRKSDALDICLQLASIQKENGAVFEKDSKNRRSNDFTTITYSYGRDYEICCTSLAVLAWIRCHTERFMENINKVKSWLSTQCYSGRFGSTHSTILALKALVAIESLSPEIDVYQKVDIFLNNELVQTYDYEKTTNRQLQIGPKFHPGPQHIKLVLNDGEARCNCDTIFCYELPDNHPDCCLKLETRLSSNKINEGEGSEIFVTITNTDQYQGVPMVTAIVRIPSGLEPRHRQLKDLVDKGTVAYYETKNREVAFFFREMGPGQVLEFKMDVTASYPGTYVGNASCVYLYYTDDEKYWCEGINVNIKPSEN